jgi:hypothetical protein
VPPTLAEAHDARAVVPLTRLVRPSTCRAIRRSPCRSAPRKTCQQAQLVGRRGADADLLMLADDVFRQIFQRRATMSAAVQLADRADDDALKTLLDMVSARARQFGEDQQIDAETVEAMKAAGVYRALVPTRFGGDEKSPADFLRLLEAISTHDGSAGWVASFGVSHMYLASLPAKR